MIKGCLAVFLSASLFFMTVSAGFACSEYDPLVGGLEREGVIEALQGELLESFGIEAEFVFNWFGIEDVWAWVESEPRSPDGLNRYEPFLALLKKEGENWAVTEVPPLEDGSPPVDDAYFRSLMERCPGLPEGIFPWER